MALTLRRQSRDRRGLQRPDRRLLPAELSRFYPCTDTPALPRDIVGGQNAVAQSGVTRIATPLGPAAKIGNTAGNRTRHIQVPPQVFTGSFTLFLHGRLNTSLGDGYVYCQRSLPGGYRVYIQVIGGQWSVTMDASEVIAGGTVTYGRDFCLTLSMDAVSRLVRLVVDGREIGSAVRPDTTDYWTTAAIGSYINQSASSTSTGVDLTVYSAGSFGRAISAPAARALTADPGRLYRRQQWSPLVADAAAGPTTLDPADSTHGHVAGPVGYVLASLLGIESASHGHTAVQALVDIAASLGIESATHGHAADGIAVTVTQVLEVLAATHGQSAGSAAFTLVQVLEVLGAIHAHSATAPTLNIGALLLEVAGAQHGHAATGPTFTLSQVLEILGAAHGHTATAGSISAAGVLAVADAIHGHSATATGLASQVLVTIADALHAHAVTGGGLSQSQALAIAGAVHGLSSGAVDIVTGLVLVAQDGVHALSSGAVEFTQAHVLTTLDALHGHSVTAPGLSIGLTLLPGDAVHGHSVSGVTLDAALLLAVQDAVHAVQDAGLALAQQQVLIVSDALHGHLAALAGFATGVISTPDSRVFLVLAEDRTFIVARES